MGNAQERPSETIDRERKRLVETLQADSGLLLDALLARGVLNGPEYEALDALPDAERRVRRLLLLVQSKGEAACQELLRCAQQTARAPDPAWDWQHVGPEARAEVTAEKSIELETLPLPPQATGTAAMTPRAPATGRLRHLVPAAYALGYLELQTTMRLGVLKDRRPCNPGPQRSQSQKLKGLNRIWSQNQRQNQSRNWNQSRSRSPSPSRRLMSLKIPEGQSFPHPRLCWMGPDGMPAPKAGLTQLQVNKLQTVGLAWALPTTVLFAQALRAGGTQP